MQGVFLRGPDGTFDRVLVNDNTVVGGMTNGIYVDGAANVEVSHNVVAGYSGAKSWIRLENTSNARVMDNDKIRLRRSGMPVNRSGFIP